jgi:hypothetical protein
VVPERLPGEWNINRFCLITTGRTGSTALMDAIAAIAGVVVPAVDIECRDHELVHPDRFAQYSRAYSTLTGRTVETPSQLIDAYYYHHLDKPWVGFKTMVDRHPDMPGFVARDDIRFITLVRRDVVATCASFMLAKEHATWRRRGGLPAQRWTFSADNRQRVLENLAYIHKSLRLLSLVPGAIRLTYEDLCTPGHIHSGLNALFGSPVAINSPQAPIDASEYVTNWQEFQEFCTLHWK